MILNGMAKQENKSGVKTIDRRNSKKKNKSKKIFVILMLAWPVANWLVFTLFMNLQTVVYSFQRLNRFTGKMRFAGFGNYVELFEKIISNTSSYGVAFRNTFLWLGLNVLVIVPLSLVAV